MLRGPCFTLIGALGGGILMFPGASSAVESPWADAGQARVRLLAADPVKTSGPVHLRGGIEIRIARGWHTYWRYPGDAGVPPRFDWSGSDNLAAIEVRFPAPERMVEAGGPKIIGYLDSVVFPLRIRPADPARPVKLRLKLDFAVCEKLCVPAEVRLEIEVPAGGGAPLSAIEAAEARVPKPMKLGESKGLGVLSVRLERGKEPRALVEVAVPAGTGFDLFAEGPTEDWALPLPDKIEAKGGRARFTVPIDGAPPGMKPGSFPAKLKFTLVAGNEAIEVEAPLD
jgi:DsbC/DsbD-like thiol-disulfide interchange protein